MRKGILALFLGILVLGIVLSSGTAMAARKDIAIGTDGDAVNYTLRWRSCVQVETADIYSSTAFTWNSTFDIWHNGTVSSIAVYQLNYTVDDKRGDGVTANLYYQNGTLIQAANSTPASGGYELLVFDLIHSAAKNQTISNTTAASANTTYFIIWSWDSFDSNRTATQTTSKNVKTEKILYCGGTDLDIGGADKGNITLIYLPTGWTKRDKIDSVWFNDTTLISGQATNGYSSGAFGVRTTSTYGATVFVNGTCEYLNITWRTTPSAEGSGATSDGAKAVWRPGVAPTGFGAGIANFFRSIGLQLRIWLSAFQF